MLCIDNKKMDNILETKKTKKGRLSTEHIKSTEAGYKESNGRSESWTKSYQEVKSMQKLIAQYVEAVKKIYGSHVRQIILYGSYAKGDFRPDSDVDIMILVDMSELELKAYRQQLSYMTYDFNMDHDLDIKPIAKSEAHFNKWVVNYPFYSNVHKEGVVLYGAA